MRSHSRLNLVEDKPRENDNAKSEAIAAKKEKQIKMSETFDVRPYVAQACKIYYKSIKYLGLKESGRERETESETES